MRPSEFMENYLHQRTSSTFIHPLLFFISCGRYFCGMLGVKPTQSWGDLVRQICSQASVTQKTRTRSHCGKMDTLAPVSTSWSWVPCLMLSWLFLAPATSACPGIGCYLCCPYQRHIVMGTNVGAHWFYCSYLTCSYADKLNYETP